MSTRSWITPLLAMTVVAACEPSEFRGSAKLAPPSTTPRVAAGGTLGLSISSQLERKRSNGSLVPQASSGPHYDVVGATIVAAKVSPEGIAEVHLGTKEHLQLTGITPGTATVTIRGDVNGQSSELSFEIHVVDVGMIQYDFATDMGTTSRGAVATLARGFCYRRTVEIFDEQGRSIPGDVDLAPSNLRDTGCGPHGIMSSALGSYTLPTIGSAKAVQVDFVEPKLEVIWYPVPSATDHGILFSATVVATDANGTRIPLPFGLMVELAVEGPFMCEVSGLRQVIRRSPHEECRVKVSVPRGPGETTLVMNSELPREPG
jgi:hypothetical protein